MSAEPLEEPEELTDEQLEAWGKHEKVVVLTLSDWAIVSGTLGGLHKNFPEEELAPDWKRLEDDIDNQITEQP